MLDAVVLVDLRDERGVLQILVLRVHCKIGFYLINNNSFLYAYM